MPLLLSLEFVENWVSASESWEVTYSGECTWSKCDGWREFGTDGGGRTNLDDKLQQWFRQIRPNFDRKRITNCRGIGGWRGITSHKDGEAVCKDKEESKTEQNVLEIKTLVIGHGTAEFWSPWNRMASICYCKLAITNQTCRKDGY